MFMCLHSAILRAGRSCLLNGGLARWLPLRLEDAVRMATLTPAVVLGLSERKGRIAAGADADLVVLDEGLEVAMTFGHGGEVYSRE